MVYDDGLVTELEMKIRCDVTYLKEIRNFITKICKEVGFNDIDVNRIRLAVDEACSNIFLHSYKGKRGWLDISTQVSSDSFIIKLIDNGESFDWNAVPKANLDKYVEEGKKGGLGVHFMKKLMDSVEYKVTEKGNELTLIKKINRSEITDNFFKKRKNN